MCSRNDIFTVRRNLFDLGLTLSFSDFVDLVGESSGLGSIEFNESGRFRKIGSFGRVSVDERQIVVKIWSSRVGSIL